MNRFEISAEEYEALKSAEQATSDKNARRRLKILMMRYEGYKVRQIAEITGMRINSISQMCRRYRQQGLEEFIANKHVGNHRSLSQEQERAILARFEQAAAAGQEVTAKEIKRAFDGVRGKDTGRGYIYMVLKRHGWRKVAPGSKHPGRAGEASEAADRVHWIPGKP